MLALSGILHVKTPLQSGNMVQFMYACMYSIVCFYHFGDSSFSARSN